MTVQTPHRTQPPQDPSGRLSADRRVPAGHIIVLPVAKETQRSDPSARRRCSQCGRFISRDSKSSSCARCQAASRPTGPRTVVTPALRAYSAPHSATRRLALQRLRRDFVMARPSELRFTVPDGSAAEITSAGVERRSPSAVMFAAVAAGVRSMWRVARGVWRLSWSSAVALDLRTRRVDPADRRQSVLVDTLLSNAGAYIIPGAVIFAVAALVAVIAMALITPVPT